MIKHLLPLIAVCVSVHSSLAVEQLATPTATPTFNTTDPGFLTSTDTSTAAYVGQVSGASGTYLRNGYVLTAAHVPAGNFTLGGTTYLFDGTTQTFGTADLRIFHLTIAPNLPALTISATPPTALSPVSAGTQVEIVGYGGNPSETFGINTVTQINRVTTVTVGANTYTSTDFATAYGTTTAGPNSATNTSVVVTGDSGGGDFAGTPGTYALVGINEAVDGSNNSYFVQLSTYKTQIDAATAVPEPSTWLLIGLGLLVVGGKAVAARRRAA